MADLTAKLVTEFIGTFIFLGTILTAVAASDPAMASGVAPLAIGIALMAVIYLGGGISGGNYNPAVSFMFFLKNGDLNQFAAYVVAQLFGAAMAFQFVSTFNAAYK